MYLIVIMHNCCSTICNVNCFALKLKSDVISRYAVRFSDSILAGRRVLLPRVQEASARDAELLPLHPFYAMSRLSIMTFNASRASTTCFLLSFKYLRTSSLPPPGLYSPNCEMKAIELLIFVALFQSSVAS